MHFSSVLWSGFDSVYYSVAIDRESTDNFTDLILQCSQIEKDTHFDIGNLTFIRSARGMAGFPVCIMNMDGWRVFLPSARALHTGIYIQLPPTYLSKYTPQEIDTAILWLIRDHFRLQVSKIRISRVDMTFDLQCVNQFRDLPVPNIFAGTFSNLVSSADFRSLYGQPFYTGLSVGKSDIRFRFYDKKTQIDKEGLDKQYYIDLWKMNEWHQYDVARVEFVLRGEVLRQFYIDNDDYREYIVFDTLQKIYDYKQTLLFYLFGWIRFIEPRSRKIDAPLMDWWQEITKLCISADFSQPQNIRRSYMPRTLETDQLKKQYAGILRAIIARKMVSAGFNQHDLTLAIEHYHGYSENILDEFLALDDWHEKMSDAWYKSVIASNSGTSYIPDGVYTI